MGRSGSNKSLARASIGRASDRNRPAQLLLVNQPEIRRQVRYLVRCLAHETDLRDDLCQEALVHLWQSEARYPRQPAKWHLRSCYFCIQDLLKRGSSAHSLRHRSRLLAIEESREANESEGSEDLISKDNPAKQVSFRDIFVCLCRLLEPVERTVLALLAQGYRVCEIAERLRVSYQTVIRHRSRIAATAISIGFSHDVGFTPPIRISNN